MIKIKSAGDTPEQVRARVQEVHAIRTKPAYDIVHMPPGANEARARVLRDARMEVLLDTRMEDTLELAPRRPLPDIEYDIVGVHTARLKVPSVVMRVDGRYGVAYPARFDDMKYVPRFEDAATALRVRDDEVLDSRAWTRRLGCGVFNTSGTSGFRHCPETFATRLEAEQHAWKLARKFATTYDWR